ncbi:Uncharacterized protein HZ326_15414 [Fusarium oxysporum f. sp. albedinis]|nr:Uncharacterized protein HZ326_15414 [Fusarium oxysporum f. sp. albedinis]
MLYVNEKPVTLPNVVETAGSHLVAAPPTPIPASSHDNTFTLAHRPAISYHGAISRFSASYSGNTHASGIFGNGPFGIGAGAMLTTGQAVGALLIILKV